jgi:hypothetical protein
MKLTTKILKEMIRKELSEMSMGIPNVLKVHNMDYPGYLFEPSVQSIKVDLNVLAVQAARGDSAAAQKYIEMAMPHVKDKEYFNQLLGM